VADRSTRVLKRTSPLTAVDKLVLSQDRRPATNTFNTSGIQRDRTNTIQCRTDHLLRSWPELSEVPEKSLCARTDCSFVSFAYINVSQGSVATQIRCGEIINNHFIANFPQSVTVKEF